HALDLAVGAVRAFRLGPGLPDPGDRVGRVVGVTVGVALRRVLAPAPPAAPSGNPAGLLTGRLVRIAVPDVRLSGVALVLGGALPVVPWRRLGGVRPVVVGAPAPAPAPASAPAAPLGLAALVGAVRRVVRAELVVLADGLLRVGRRPAAA